MHGLFRCGNDDARGITNNQSNESEDTKELAIDHPRCRQDMDLTEVCQLSPQCFAISTICGPWRLRANIY